MVVLVLLEEVESVDKLGVVGMECGWLKRKGRQQVLRMSVPLSLSNATEEKERGSYRFEESDLELSGRVGPFVVRSACGSSCCCCCRRGQGKEWNVLCFG